MRAPSRAESLLYGDKFKRTDCFCMKNITPQELETSLTRPNPGRRTSKSRPENENQLPAQFHSSGNNYYSNNQGSDIVDDGALPKPELKTSSLTLSETSTLLYRDKMKYMNKLDVSKTRIRDQNTGIPHGPSDPIQMESLGLSEKKSGRLEHPASGHLLAKDSIPTAGEENDVSLSSSGEREPESEHSPEVVESSAVSRTSTGSRDPPPKDPNRISRRSGSGKGDERIPAGNDAPSKTSLDSKRRREDFQESLADADESPKLRKKSRNDYEDELTSRITGVDDDRERTCSSKGESDERRYPRKGRVDEGRYPSKEEADEMRHFCKRGTDGRRYSGKRGTNEKIYSSKGGTNERRYPKKGRTGGGRYPSKEEADEISNFCKGGIDEGRYPSQEEADEIRHFCKGGIDEGRYPSKRRNDERRYYSKGEADKRRYSGNGRIDERSKCFDTCSMSSQRSKSASSLIWCKRLPTTDDQANLGPYRLADSSAKLQRRIFEESAKQSRRCSLERHSASRGICERFIRAPVRTRPDVTARSSPVETYLRGGRHEPARRDAQSTTRDAQPVGRGSFVHDSQTPDQCDQSFPGDRSIASQPKEPSERRIDQSRESLPASRDKSENAPARPAPDKDRGLSSLGVCPIVRVGDRVPREMLRCRNPPEELERRWCLSCCSPVEINIFPDSCYCNVEVRNGPPLAVDDSSFTTRTARRSLPNCHSQSPNAVYDERNSSPFVANDSTIHNLNGGHANESNDNWMGGRSYYDECQRCGEHPSNGGWFGSSPQDSQYTHFPRSVRNFSLNNALLNRRTSSENTSRWNTVLSVSSNDYDPGLCRNNNATIDGEHLADNSIRGERGSQNVGSNESPRNHSSYRRDPENGGSFISSEKPAETPTKSELDIGNAPFGSGRRLPAPKDYFSSRPSDARVADEKGRPAPYPYVVGGGDVLIPRLDLSFLDDDEVAYRPSGDDFNSKATRSSRRLAYAEKMLASSPTGGGADSDVRSKSFPEGVFEETLRLSDGIKNVRESLIPRELLSEFSNDIGANAPAPRIRFSMLPPAKLAPRSVRAATLRSGLDYLADVYERFTNLKPERVSKRKRLAMEETKSRNESVRSGRDGTEVGDDASRKQELLEERTINVSTANDKTIGKTLGGGFHPWSRDKYASRYPLESRVARIIVENDVYGGVGVKSHSGVANQWCQSKSNKTPPKSTAVPSSEPEKKDCRLPTDRRKTRMARGFSLRNGRLFDLEVAKMYVRQIFDKYS